MTFIKDNQLRNFLHFIIKTNIICLLLIDQLVWYGYNIYVVIKKDYLNMASNEATQIPRIKIFTCTNLIKKYYVYWLNKYASSLKVYIIQFTDPDQAIWAQKVCTVFPRIISALE